MYKIEIKRKDIPKLNLIMSQMPASLVVESGRLYIQTKDKDVAAFLIYYLS